MTKDFTSPEGRIRNLNGNSDAGLGLIPHQVKYSTIEATGETALFSMVSRTSIPNMSPDTVDISAIQQISEKD